VVDFNPLNWLSGAENPPCELDVINVATANARSVNSKSLNFTGLRRTELDVLDFDKHHKPRFPSFLSSRRTTGSSQRCGCQQICAVRSMLRLKPGNRGRLERSMSRS
jgi:hypothetical protein